MDVEFERFDPKPVSDINAFFSDALLPAHIAIDEAQRWLNDRQHGLPLLKFGIPVMDDYLRLADSELTLVGGRAGTGKTIIGMQIVRSVLGQLRARNAFGVAVVFSAEMSRSALMLREASIRSGVNIATLRLGQANDADFAKMHTALDACRDTYRALWIDQSGAPTLDDMLGKLDAIRQQMPVRFMLFDYTELAGEYDQQESRRVSRIVDGLKGIANTLRIPVVALSQLNRSIEGRADKTPVMSDFMYGGEKPADAMVVIAPNDSAPMAREITIVKHRHGPGLGKSGLALLRNMELVPLTLERVPLEVTR